MIMMRTLWSVGPKGPLLALLAAALCVVLVPSGCSAEPPAGDGGVPAGDAEAAPQEAPASAELDDAAGGEEEEDAADSEDSGSDAQRGNPRTQRLDECWRPFKPRPGMTGLSPEEREKIEQLEALGYSAGQNPVHAVSGVLGNNQAQAHQGLNLYISGHAPVAILMDMDGKVIHQWYKEFRELWPDYRIPPNVPEPTFWRRVHLFPNGDLLAIYDNHGLVKLDKDSNVLWKLKERVHHDLDVAEDGRIYILEHKITKLEIINPKRPVILDSIMVLSPDGEVLEQHSMFDLIRNSFYAPMLNSIRRSGDLFHTNTITLLDGTLADKAPAFKKGNLLICMRNIGTIGIIDLEQESMVWSMRGMFHGQHEPVLLENERMIIFDNRFAKGRSRILEFDPLSQQVFWTYGHTDEQFFYSEFLGSVQRLPNGNTLISESNNGRVFEVNREKEIVWEFINPHRAGDEDQFVANVYEMVRLKPDYPHDWADPATAELDVRGAKPVAMQ